MREIEFKLDDYILELSFDEDKSDINTSKELVLMGYRGHGGVLRIPETIEYCDTIYYITHIGKKAFLGNGSVRTAVLPSSVRSIGDWAFAQCDKLNTVIIEGQNGVSQISFGKGVFLDCTGLSDVCVGYEEIDCQSALLGAALCHMDAEYLLHDRDLGEKEWFEKWDNRLETYIAEKDSAGYTNLVLCGEEDIQKSKPGYVSDKRKKKAKLCMLRLMQNKYLDKSRYERYKEYLLSYCKGCESDETWRMILEDYGDNLDYYKELADIGGINADNIDAMLEDMGENHAEAKAFLIGYKNDKSEAEDIFDSFVL